jgi:hypothetical protein
VLENKELVLATVKVQHILKLGKKLSKVKKVGKELTLVRWSAARPCKKTGGLLA